MQIQIPVQLQKAMRELPPIPPFNESLPIPPPPSPERMNPVQLAISHLIHDSCGICLHRVATNSRT